MKRLAVCCDGTWRRLCDGGLTNVALIARAIAPRDADGNAQIVYYGAGVGATLGKPRLWEGITGADLDEHLLDAYLFLTLNYEPGDQVFLFGFSRGAYTVRSLAGLLRKCGVLRRAHAEQARAALALYRKKELSADSEDAHRFRAAYAAAWPRLDKRTRRVLTPQGGLSHDLRIRFIGVWDTVGALGVPKGLPFSRGKAYEFHDTQLSRAVQYARHAVAIDERRARFAPTLWTNVAALNPPGQRPRVTQAWFPGDHGGVGGGGRARTLSNCALMWVIEGAEEAGLKIAREPGSVVSACLAEIDPIHGALRSSGKGLSILGLLGRRWRKGLRAYDDVHETARLRWIANRSYRPKLLTRFRPLLQEFLEDTAQQGEREDSLARGARPRPMMRVLTRPGAV